MENTNKKFSLVNFFFSYEGEIGRLAYFGGVFTLNVLMFIIAFGIQRYCVNWHYLFYFGSFLFWDTIYFYSLFALVQKRCRSFGGNATGYVVVFMSTFGVRFLYDALTSYGVEDNFCEIVTALFSVGSVVAGLLLLFSAKKENQDMSKRSVLLTYPLSFCIVFVALVLFSQIIISDTFREPQKLDGDRKEEVEEYARNVWKGAGFVYRHIIGYKKVCRDYGYELTRYPEAFSEKFSEEIDLLRKGLEGFGWTFDELGAGLPKEYDETVAKLVYGELDGMRKAIILSYIALQKGVSVEEVQWSDEFDDRLSVAAVCHFFDTRADAFLPTEDDPGVQILKKVADFETCKP